MAASKNSDDMDPQLVQIHHDTVGKSSVYIDGLGDFFQQVRKRNSTKLLLFKRGTRKL